MGEYIISIGVSDGDKYAMSPNTEVEATEFIDGSLSMLMDMELTSQQSVNDVPVNQDFITIDINCDGAAGTTLFYYVEQPYQGNHKPAPALGDRITEMLASADNTPLMVTSQASVIETNDGEITSTVDGTEIPTEDDPSDLGSGSGCQYGADDIIGIYMQAAGYQRSTLLCLV